MLCTIRNLTVDNDIDSAVNLDSKKAAMKAFLK